MADLLVRGVDDALVQALKKRAELLAAMPDVGVDADFQRQDEPVAAADVFD